jgi:uncharacterized protein (TIGR03790 family)
MRTRVGLRTSLVLVGLLAWSAPAVAQSAENVAVVINDDSPDSQKVGEYYVRARSIPETNVIRIRTELTEAIDRDAYAKTIEQPIATAIGRAALQDRVLYLVLTKGVPLRINGSTGHEGTVASVDSELAVLYRRMTGDPVSVRGRIDNPYYLGVKPVSEAKPFTHRAHDIFLVSRLDGFTAEDAMALVDRALKASAEGRIVLDQRAAALSDGIGDRWLAEAARRLKDNEQGERVVLETTTTAARDVDNVLGYYSWGSNDPANRVRRFNMRFVPGALAAMFVSSDARTMESPPDEWMPASNWNDTKTWFGGSPQSLIGDLIREGATGVAGHVAEPYLQSAARPEILFPAYLAGFNLIEAFYLALPHLSWQTIVVGDPLCVPFPRKTLTRAEIEDAPDPQTEFPGLFARRRVERGRATLPNVPPEAVTLLLLSEARLARNDSAGAAQALEEATRLAPSLQGAQTQLGVLYGQSGQTAKSLELYRNILKTQPNNLVALNNMAYLLAVDLNTPKDGLPFARKAAAIAPEDPNVLDTLGWVLHLLGDDQEAAKHFSEAVGRGTNNVEIRVHAAIVFAAVGRNSEAQAQIKEAIRIEPTAARRPDVLEVRKRLANLQK